MIVIVIVTIIVVIIIIAINIIISIITIISSSITRKHPVSPTLLLCWVSFRVSLGFL